MSDRDRTGRGGERQDWASQVPWHYGRPSPYEDYGWEPGESVLPEFRDPSVHEMPYDRERYPREQGMRGERQSRPGGGMDAQRRGMMRNPYDDDYDYDRSRYGRGSMGRSYDENRWRSGQGYSGGYDDGRTRWSGQGSYGGMYNRDYGRGYDEDRWRSGQGYSGGMYNRDYGSYGRGYDEDRWRWGGQNYSGGMHNRDYGSYGRGYDEDRWRSGQGYSGSSYSAPTSWTYTEYWYIPGPHTGRGPKGYQRSDERIKEDVCERLMQHGQIDASDMEIDVQNGEVTLRGTVDQRQAKRMAEDAAESVSGVREVRNELRVRQEQQGSSGQNMSGQNTGAQQREIGGQNRS
jgi:hypothetical protein